MKCVVNHINCSCLLQSDSDFRLVFHICKCRVFECEHVCSVLLFFVCCCQGISDCGVLVALGKAIDICHDAVGGQQCVCVGGGAAKEVLMTLNQLFASV